MTKEEQTKIVLDLLEKLTQIVIQRIDRCPAYWCGLELRHLIKDLFIEHFVVPLPRDRQKHYKNDYSTLF